MLPNPNFYSELDCVNKSLSAALMKPLFKSGCCVSVLGRSSHSFDCLHVFYAAFSLQTH